MSHELDLANMAIGFLRKQLGIHKPTANQISEIERLLSIVVIREMLSDEVVTRLEVQTH